MKQQIAIPMLVWCLPLMAQFENLVTNDDGSVVYFSSPLRMRGSGQVEHAKLFAFDAHGLRLVMQRRSELTVPEFPVPVPVTNYHFMEAAAIDGSGSSVAVITRRECAGGCPILPKYRTEFGGREYRGKISLSRNGRYALLWDEASWRTSSFIDLATGQSVTWFPTELWWIGHGRRQVSSTGTAVFATDRGLHVLRLDGERVLQLSAPRVGSPHSVAIDDNARTAVYVIGETLYAMDLATGATRTLATSSGSGRPMQPCISNDGTVVLFVGAGDTTPQIFITTSAGGLPRQITADPTGIHEAVLSGDGRTAYAVTRRGGLLRVRIESAAVEEIIATPVRFSTEAVAAPGSAVTIGVWPVAHGAESARPPLPRRLAGVEVLLDGELVPLLGVTPGSIHLQIPWETAPGKHRFEVLTDASPLFEVSSELQVRSQFPAFQIREFVYRGPALILAAHEDFSGLVTGTSPARPGEIVHAYMTGLGPVSPFVETGHGGPSNPPAGVITPLTCDFNHGLQAEVQFAGLAPGLVGYYQVSIRVPGEAPSGNVPLTCGTPERTFASTASLPVSR